LMWSILIKLGLGYAPRSPYDAIHVTKVMAESEIRVGDTPWQLASPGRMVTLFRTDGRDAIIQVDKDATGDVSQKALRI